jgi:hypothetical protein
MDLLRIREVMSLILRPKAGYPKSFPGFVQSLTNIPWFLIRRCVTFPVDITSLNKPNLRGRANLAVM